MTKPLKLVGIGNSTGIVLPRELLARLGLTQGDTVSVSETAEGIEIKHYDPEFEAQMATAREVMERRYSALRELAK